MKKIFSNKEIAKQTNLIYENFQENNDLILPLKVNYALQMNYKILSERAELFDDMKEKITKKYGYYSEDEKKYMLCYDKVDEAQDEFNDFLTAEQSLDIMTITLEDLGKCGLTSQQMQTLLFMID